MSVHDQPFRCTLEANVCIKFQCYVAKLRLIIKAKCFLFEALHESLVLKHFVFPIPKK